MLLSLDIFRHLVVIFCFCLLLLRGCTAAVWMVSRRCSLPWPGLLARVASVGVVRGYGVCAWCVCVVWGPCSPREMAGVRAWLWAAQRQGQARAVGPLRPASG